MCITLNEKLSALLKEHYSQTGDIINTIHVDWLETLGNPPRISKVSFSATSDHWIKTEGEIK